MKHMKLFTGVILGLVCGLLLILQLDWHERLPSKQPGVQDTLQWTGGAIADFTEDRTITYGPEPVEPSLTFSANWPSTQRICVLEGCLTLQEIREQVMAKAEP